MANVDGARLYHRVSQGKIIITRPAPILPPLYQPFPHLLQAHQPSKGKPTVTKTVTVATHAWGMST